MHTCNVVPVGAAGWLRHSLVGSCLLLLLGAAGCDSAQGEHLEPREAATASAISAPSPEPHHDAHHHAHTAQPEPGEHTDYSIYHLESAWWDQQGKRGKLESLAGRVQVVSMVYTHCAHTCPRVLMAMKRIEAEITGTHPDGIGFVLVSIDPERDTPDRLASFAETTRLDPERWTLLSGSDDDILELATLLGIKYRRESESDFSHSNTLLVLNPAGEVVFQQPSLDADPAPTLAAIRSVLPAPTPLPDR